MVTGLELVPVTPLPSTLVQFTFVGGPDIRLSVYDQIILVAKVRLTNLVFLSISDAFNYSRRMRARFPAKRRRKYVPEKRERVVVEVVYLP